MAPDGISIGFINRSTGATVNFAGRVIASGSINSSGILGGFATFGSDWATVNNASLILPFGGYVPASLAANTDNSIVTPTGLNVTGPITVNSLKLTGGPGFGLSANTLALTSGGLLYNGSGASSIAGTGLITGESGTNDLFINTASGTLALGVPIIGAGGSSNALVKNGAGKLALFGSSSYTGPIFVNSGRWRLLGLAEPIIPALWAATPSAASS